MHNWHLHALHMLFFFQGFFACNLISPADWQSFLLIVFYFLATFQNVDTSRLDWGLNSTGFVYSLDPAALHATAVKYLTYNIYSSATAVVAPLLSSS